MRKRKEPVLIPIRNANNDGWEFKELWEYQDIKTDLHPEYSFIVHESLDQRNFYAVSEKRTGLSLPILEQLYLQDQIQATKKFLSRKTPAEMKEAMDKAKAIIDNIKKEHGAQPPNINPDSRL